MAIAHPVSASPRENARVRKLNDVMRTGKAALVSPDGERLSIPRDVYNLFLQVLELLQEGKAISIVPYMQELTTEQAAAILGMSRQHLIRLIEKGEIEHHKVGTHRRIYLEHLLGYKHKRDVARREGLKDLIRLSKGMGLYDKVVIPRE